MNPDWKDFLRANGARFNEEIVGDFGNLSTELMAARDATIISPLSHLGLIECVGEDARSFLQNQLTSDVNHLEIGSAQYSSWCSPKGRMLASFILFRSEASSSYLAMLSADLEEFIQKRLQIYVLRSKVKIENRSIDHEFFGLSGPQADSALKNAGITPPSAPMQSATFDNGTVIRLDNERHIVIVASGAAPSLWQKLTDHATPAGTPVWQWLDIAAGIPRIEDATKEAFVPQMANLDKIGGVSFQKGCYPGQEVVARTRYLGKVKRHLYRVHADTAIAAGMPVSSATDPTQPCGQIANAAPSPAGGYEGLAVILEGSLENSVLHANLPDGNSIALTNISIVGE